MCGDRIGRRVFFVLLSLVVACQEPIIGQPEDVSAQLSPEEIREDLFARGYPFTGHSFFRAVRQHDLDSVRLFVEGGIDLNSLDDFGGNVLTLVMGTTPQDMAMARYLLDQDIDVNVPPGGQASPLTTAVKFDNPDMVRELLKRGADVDYAGLRGETPLIAAASQGNVRCARILLEHGADVAAVNDSGRNAAQVAGRSRQVAEQWERDGLQLEAQGRQLDLEQLVSQSRELEQLLHSERQLQELTESTDRFE